MVASQVTEREPEYEYVKGQGWVLCLTSFGFSAVDLNGRKLRVYAQRPKPGDLYMVRNELETIIKLQDFLNIVNTRHWRTWETNRTYDDKFYYYVLVPE